MKKLFAAMLLALVTLAACPVWAADVPVYFRGHLTTTGLERDGAIYLSQQGFFESMAIEVGYYEASQKLNLQFTNVNFTNGGQLDMQVGSRDADYNRSYYDHGEGPFSDYKWFEVEHTPFVKEGQAWLPLRFVAEEVLGLIVEWRDGAVYIDLPYAGCTVGDDVYSLCLASGHFYRNGELIVRLALPGYSNCHKLAVDGGLQVSRTEAGTYLVQLTGRNFGGLRHSMRWFCWIYPNPEAEGAYASQEAYISAMQSAEWLPGIVQSPGKVWLNDGGQVYCLDEAEGYMEIINQNQWLQQVLQDEYTGGYLQAVLAEGRLALLGDTDGYVLYDMQAEQGVDITPLLLTAEVKAQAEAFLRAEAPVDFQPEADLAYYWAGLGKQSLAVGDVFPYLHFVGADAAVGVLNFELRCHYHTSGYGDSGLKVYPLSLDIQQIFH